MKKFTAMILSLVLVLSLSVPAMAATVTETGTQTADVKGKYVDNTTAATVFSIDITWGSMEFVYTESGTKTWNPADHSYTTTNASAGWAEATEGAGNFTITNHSNAEIYVTPTYNSASGFAAVTGKIMYEGIAWNSAASKPLESGEGVSHAEADSCTFSVVLSGAPKSLGTEATTVGTITLTISDQ